MNTNKLRKLLSQQTHSKRDTLFTFQEQNRAEQSRNRTGSGWQQKSHRFCAVCQAL